MIAVLPQKGQRHRSANGPADEEQSHWVSGCFIGGSFGISAITKSAYGSMSLNNNNPVNNESQGSGNGSGNWAEHKGRYKGLGLPGANHEHSDQVKDRKGDG